MGELTHVERDILAFELQQFDGHGLKEQAIRDAFDVTATYYHRTLDALIDRPEALAHDPLLVRRLLRLRASDRATRQHPSTREANVPPLARRDIHVVPDWA